jgi:hypothetical protein
VIIGYSRAPHKHVSRLYPIIKWPIPVIFVAKGRGEKRADGDPGDDYTCQHIQSLCCQAGADSVRISLLMVQLSVGSDQLDFYGAALAGLLLILWRVKDDIFLSEVLCHLAERAE